MALFIAQTRLIIYYYLAQIRQGVIMRLDEYMENEGLSFAQLADMTGVSRRALYRYAKHQRVPREPVMRIIIQATNHKVLPNDFFGL